MLAFKYLQPFFSLLLGSQGLLILLLGDRMVFKQVLIPLVVLGSTPKLYLSRFKIAGYGMDLGVRCFSIEF